MENREPDRRNFDKLTDKQRETLNLVASGLTSKEAARKLGVSPHTIDQRIASVRKKLGISTRRALIGLCRGLPEKLYEQTVYQPPYVGTKLGTGHEYPVGSARPTASLPDHLIALDGHTDVEERVQRWIENSLGSGHPALKGFKSTLAVLASCAIIFALMYSALRVLMRLITSLF